MSSTVSNKKAYTYINAPPSIRGKWRYLFGSIPTSMLHKLKMDDVAMYSMTDHKTASKITNIILSLKGITTSSTIFDAMACVGGNTISFANKGLSIIANEMNKSRFHILKNNVHVYGVERFITFYNNDFLELYKKFHVDVVFMDPPWGGPDCCKQKDLIHITISNIPLSKICYQLRYYTKYIVLKLPLNFDDKSFQKELYRLSLNQKKYKITLNSPISLKKMMILIVQFQIL